MWDVFIRMSAVCSSLLGLESPVNICGSQPNFLAWTVEFLSYLFSIWWICWFFLGKLFHSLCVFYSAEASRTLTATWPVLMCLQAFRFRACFNTERESILLQGIVCFLQWFVFLIMAEPVKTLTLLIECIFWIWGNLTPPLASLTILQGHLGVVLFKIDLVSIGGCYSPQPCQHFYLGLCQWLRWMWATVVKVYSLQNNSFNIFSSLVFILGGQFICVF